MGWDMRSKVGKHVAAVRMMSLAERSRLTPIFDTNWDAQRRIGVDDSAAPASNIRAFMHIGERGRTRRRELVVTRLRAATEADYVGLSPETFEAKWDEQLE